jgi:heme oxygenase
VARVSVHAESGSTTARTHDREAPSWALTRLEKRLGSRVDDVAKISRASLVIPTRDTYRRYLCDLYGFITAFEARLAYTYALDLSFIENRIKSGRIATDLLVLGLTPYERTRLSQRCAVPRFPDVRTALGWLYVVERLMQDTPELRRRLSETLPHDVLLAGEFIGRAAEEIEMRWAELARVLDRFVYTKRELETTLAAAGSALECLESWLLTPPAVNDVDSELSRFP